MTQDEIDAAKSHLVWVQRKRLIFSTKADEIEILMFDMYTAEEKRVRKLLGKNVRVP